MLGALQGGFTATATATAEAKSKAKSKAAARSAAAFDLVFAVDVASAFAVDVHPPLHAAEHRSDLWGQPAWMPAERGQAMDGLSARYPRDREKRRAPTCASVSRESAACRGAHSFGYFPWAFKESNSRDSAK